MKKALIASVAVAALMLPAAAMAQEGTVKFGILVALEGAFAEGGADGVRNVELAIKQAGGTAGGKKIEVVVAPTDTTPDTTIRQARKLIEQDGVDIILGPLSGSEGIAMRDYAKTIPNNTVINGISGALETTWVEPAENFFRFNLHQFRGRFNCINDEGGLQPPVNIDREAAATFKGTAGKEMDNFCSSPLAAAQPETEVVFVIDPANDGALSILSTQRLPGLSLHIASVDINGLRKVVGCGSGRGRETRLFGQCCKCRKTDKKACNECSRADPLVIFHVGFPQIAPGY